MDRKKIKLLLAVVVVLIVVFIAFYPALFNGFTNWDDTINVIKNESARDLSLSGIKKIFLHPPYKIYVPLTHVTFALEYQLFSLKPFGYHALNLLLHLASCALVFMLISAVSNNWRVAFIASLLFGIHPLKVEPVAWVSGRSDVLYGFFFLCACIAYQHYLQGGWRRMYWYAGAFFVLSLLSKPMAITFCLLLFVFDYIYEKTPRERKTFKLKSPFFLVAALYITITFLSAQSLIQSEKASGLLSRVSIASFAALFYIYKIIMPVKFSCVYPYQGAAHIPCLEFFLCMNIALWAGIIFSLRYTKKIMFGFLFFIITLLPALQFIPFGETMVADRYAYIPAIGIFYIIAEGITLLLERIKKGSLLKPLFIIFLAVMTVGGVFFTRQRCEVWRDSLSLWNDALKTYPGVATPHNNRGAVLLDQKQYQKAYADLKTALAIDPYFYEAYFNLGSLYNAQGNYSQAIAMLNKALQVYPLYKQAYDMLIGIYERLRMHGEIIKSTQKMIALWPNDAEAYINLCGAYGNEGQMDKAIASCKKALDIVPQSGLVHMNLAAAYYFHKDYAKALTHCDRARQFGFEVPEAFMELLLPYRGKHPAAASQQTK